MEEILALLGSLSAAAYGILALVTEFRDKQRQITRPAWLVLGGLTLSGVLALIGTWLTSQTSERTEMARYEKTLQSIWTETNQIALDDITAQIRFTAQPRENSTPPETFMFQTDWDLILSIRSPDNAEAYALHEQNQYEYYKSNYLFKTPVDLSLTAYSQTSRPILLDYGVGQFTTFRFARHHYLQGGDLDRWRLGHHWNGAVVDAIWTSYKPPEYLTYSDDQYADAPKDNKFSRFAIVPLDARLVLYVRGLAVANQSAEAVQSNIGDRKVISVRFHRMKIKDKAFSSPPFEPQEDARKGSFGTTASLQIAWIIVLGLVVCSIEFARSVQGARVLNRDESDSQETQSSGKCK